MRFARRPYDDRYEAIAAHKLDVLEKGNADLLPPINSSMLDGCPPCPYCENPVAGMCPCGTLFCTSGNLREPITCPGCRAQLVGGEAGSIDIKRSMG